MTTPPADARPTWTPLYFNFEDGKPVFSFRLDSDQPVNVKTGSDAAALLNGAPTPREQQLIEIIRQWAVHETDAIGEGIPDFIYDQLAAIAPEHFPPEQDWLDREMAKRDCVVDMDVIHTITHLPQERKETPDVHPPA